MEYMSDEWPKAADGSDYDGKQLLQLVRAGKSPFHGVWDVNLLLDEVEKELNTKVIDIPLLSDGSNNYGFHCRLSNRPDILIRFAKDDVNMPNFDGWPLHRQVSDVRFEAAAYELLLQAPQIKASRMLSYRIPVKRENTMKGLPNDILGRRLMVFEMGNGARTSFYDLTADAKRSIVEQAAQIRASLFDLPVPLTFGSQWFLERLFEHKPDSLPVPVSPTRNFCLAMLTSKIHATIGEVGQMIAWPSDNVTVGPRAAAAKQSILRALPYIIPVGSAAVSEDSLYRLVLEHDDYGTHNMSIDNSNGQSKITSLYDWETGSVVPALLSDPRVCVSADFDMRDKMVPCVSRLDKMETAEALVEYGTLAALYFQTLFKQSFEYERVIKAGLHLRHLWFKLKDWRGDDPEGYFGELGDWAETKLKELGGEGKPA